MIPGFDEIILNKFSRLVNINQRSYIIIKRNLL